MHHPSHTHQPDPTRPDPTFHSLPSPHPQAIESAVSCTALRSLAAAGCAGLRAPRLVSCAALKELDLSSTEIGDGALADACAAAPWLERLDVSHCRSLHRPMLGGDRLRTLLATGCDGLADEAVSGASKKK
jgi:hypothetical protein